MTTTPTVWRDVQTITDAFTGFHNGRTISLTTGTLLTIFEGKASAAQTSTDIYAQIWTPAGQPVSAPIRINGIMSEDQLQPEVVALPDGGFVVAYGNTGNNLITIERFDRDLQSVAQSFVADGEGSLTEWRLAVDSVGNYTIVYHRDILSGAGENYDVQGVTYSFAGNVAGPVLTNLARNSAEPDYLSSAVITNNQLIVTASDADDGVTGTDLNAEFKIVDTQTGAVIRPTTEVPSDFDDTTPRGAVILAGGQLVVLYEDVEAVNGGIPPGFGNYVHRLSIRIAANATAALGPRIQIDATQDDPAAADIIALPDGTFFVAWEDQSQVRGRRFSSTGATIGDELPYGMSALAVGSPIVTDSTVLDLSLTSDGRILLTGDNADVQMMILDWRESYIVGTAGNDILTTQTTGSQVFGAAGNDTIYAINGGHFLFGEGGRDVIYGGNGEELIYGGDHNDLLYAGDGNDILSGGVGNDFLYGGGADDSAYGGAGNDALNGDAGNDALYGEGDTDTIFGGAGNDLLVGGAGNDRMYGGIGNDVYDVDSPGDLVGESLDEDIDQVRTLLATYFLGTNVENLLGQSAAGQRLGGNGLANRIAAAGGNDVVTGGDGNDTITGGAGNDTVYGDNGNDLLYGDGAADTLYGGAGNDSLTGGDGNDAYLGGGDGNDYVYGGLGNDRLDGGIGRDVLDGGTGNDYMTGGADDDSYRVDSAGDAVSEAAGGGRDAVDTTLATYFLTAEVEDLYGTLATGQRLGGNGSNNTIVGAAGNDVITAGAGNDTISGNDGNDRAYGEAGNDVLLGGLGADTLYGGADHDAIFGGGNDDVFLGGEAGNDVVHGEAGHDRMDGGDGNDTLYGGGGNDVMTGGAGNDILYGGDTNDLLQGGLGIDNLYGGNGNDTFRYFVADWQDASYDNVYGFAQVAPDFDRLALQGVAANYQFLDGAGFVRVYHNATGGSAYIHGMTAATLADQVTFFV